MLLVLLAFLSFLAVIGAGFAFAGGGGSSAKAAKRAQALTGAGRHVDKAKVRAVEQSGARRKQILQTLKNEERQQRKAKLTLESRIKQSGLNINVPRFWMGCGVAAVLFAVPVLIFSHNPLIALGAGFAGGLGFPRWVLSFLGKRRIKKFTEEFPNAIDVIVRGIKSGLPIGDCLKIIGRESSEPLGSEFRRMVESMSMGLGVEDGLGKMLERMPTPEVRFFSIVLGIQSKSGGNLAEALNNLSVVLRARKLMVEKVKALSGEAVASAFIIGALPILMMGLVSVVAPSYMVPMFTDPRGKVMLLVGALTMALGIFVMRKMINLKI